MTATALAYALYSRLELRWVFLGWVGLVPWILALDRTATLRGALASAVALAAAFTVAVFGWFAFAVTSYTAASPALAVALLAAAGPLVQPQFLTFAVARHLLRGRAATWIVTLAGACVYVGTEWAVPKLFGDALGYCLYPSVWMRQAADLAGAPGLTLVLVVANACAADVWRALVATDAPDDLGATVGARARRAVRPALVVVALVVLLCAYGAVRVRQIAARTAAGTPITAGIVQADLSHYDRMRAEIGAYETVRRVLDAHVAMSRALLASAKLDLLVWPETVYPTTFGVPKSADGAAFDREIADFMRAAGVPLVFGSYDVEDGAEFNAAFFLRPSDGPPAYDTYRKAWPFPLTEYVPPLLDGPRMRRWLPWLGTWKPGKGAKVVPLTLPDGRTIRIAPLICYDVLAPALAPAAVRDGADLIVTLSNDSWFANGAGPRLHLLGAAFRSIETRRPQLRATNTGVSAVITATGDIVGRADVDARATLVGRVVPDGTTRTLVVAWGDWLGPVALVAGAVTLVAVLVRGDADADQRRKSTGTRQARSNAISRT